MTFSELRPVGLDEVFSIADLQTRRDRKYLLPADAAVAVLDGIEARALEIEGRRRFRYESVYFDTPGWDSYLGAARRRPRRFKVRTRTYRDSGECVLEVKVRDHRSNTVKHRHPYSACFRDQITAAGARFVGGVAAVAPFADLLQPVLTVAYERTTLVLDDGWDRVTVDEAATWSAEPGTGVGLRGLTLIETKTPGPPCALDKLLWRAGHRPVTISKYCIGMALMRRDLPVNKWHRVLNQRVIPNLAPLP